MPTRVSATAYRKELSHPVLTELVRWIMINATTGQAPPPIRDPLATPLWDELREFMQQQRVLGHLAMAVGRDMPHSTQQRNEILRFHRQAVYLDISIESVLSQLANLFAVSALDWRVIKGLAAGRVLYQESGMRSTGDVDILVHPNQYEAALALVRRQDYIVTEIASHGPRSALYERSHTFITDQGIELDIHRYVQGPLSRHRIPTAELFSEPQTLRFGTMEILAPSKRAMVLHSMLHLGTGRSGPVSLARLSTLADLVSASRLWPEDRAAALDLARRVGCETPATWADRVTDSWLRAPPADLPTSRTLELKLWAYDRMLRSKGLTTTLARFVGPDRLRRAREAAFPSEAFLRSHQMDQGDQIRHIRERLLPGRDRR
jgi:hypothetical protein